MKRILCLMLSLLMLLPTLAACGTAPTPSESKQESETEPATEAVTETEPATEAVTETEPATEAVTETEPATEAVTETEPATEAVTETEPATEAVTETEPVTESEPQVTVIPEGGSALIADGKTDWVMTVSSGAAKSKSAVEWMRSVMEDRFGTAPVIVENAGSAPVLTFDYDKTMAKTDYRVEIADGGKKIAFTAGSETAMTRAIQQFTAITCAGNGNVLTVDGSAALSYTYATDKIDNSHFLTFEGGEKTELAPSDKSGTLMTPTWLDTAVMVEVRLDNTTLGGTFAKATKLIDFYAECGVNVIWLDPIFERGDGNGYGNNGPHLVEPKLTGTKDQEAGWAEVKKFVDYAHSKGIYILFDVITWGLANTSPIIEEHPDWFTGPSWGGKGYKWANAALKEWYISEMVHLIERTGADGLRCDLEPELTGYEWYGEVRQRLADKGIYIVIMTEGGNVRKSVYDLNQGGVYTAKSKVSYPVYFVDDGQLKIVDACKTGNGISPTDIRSKMGTFRYYTNCLTQHDYQTRAVLGSRVKMGYAGILAPFIPLWYMGDEVGSSERNAILYDVNVQQNLLLKKENNALFYEDVKKMIEIRRSYPEIFEYWPLNHRDTNICEVVVDGLTSLQNYARYMDNKMVIVAANYDKKQPGLCTVNVPFAEAFTEDYASYRVTDLMTGVVVVEGTKDAVAKFQAVVPYDTNGVYLVEGLK